MNIYRSEVIPKLLHGCEVWHLNEANIKSLEGAQRRLMLQTLGRKWDDFITSVDLYENCHNNGFKIYPMRIMLAVRKLKYYGRIVRNRGNNHIDIIGKMYWNDILHDGRIRFADNDYGHIQNIMIALRILKIPIIEGNIKVKIEKEWKIYIDGQASKIYIQWKEEEKERIIRERVNETEENRSERERRRKLPERW